jgi:hypothetical protein
MQLHETRKNQLALGSRFERGLMETEGLNPLRRLPRVLWRRECPLCSSIQFKTAEDGFLDSMLKLFGLRPVRCVNCWRRYYWFAKRSPDKS